MAYISGVRCIGVAIILSAIIGISVAEAGNFFAETPKHAPRLGRRSAIVSQLIPMKKAQRMKYFYAEIPKAMPRIGRRSQPILKETPEWDQRRDSNDPCWHRRLFPGSAMSQNSDQEGTRCLTVREFLLLTLPFMKDSAVNHSFDDTSADRDYEDWYERGFELSNTPVSREYRLSPMRDLLQQEG